MTDCCEDKACAIDALRERQSSTLKTVLGINAVMFLVELVAGIISGSGPAPEKRLADDTQEPGQAEGSAAVPAVAYPETVVPQALFQDAGVLGLPRPINAAEGHQERRLRPETRLQPDTPQECPDALVESA